MSSLAENDLEALDAFNLSHGQVLPVRAHLPLNLSQTALRVAGLIRKSPRIRRGTLPRAVVDKRRRLS